MSIPPLGTVSLLRRASRCTGEARRDRTAPCTCVATSFHSSAGQIVVLRVTGEIDVASLRLVGAALGALHENRPSHILVDLSGTRFCDVGGLTMLVDAGGSAADHGIGFSVSAAPRQAERVWTLLWDADELPPRYPTMDAAVLAVVTARSE